MTVRPLLAGAFVLTWSSGFVGTALAEPAGSTAGVLAWRYLLTAGLLSATVLLLRRPLPRPAELGQQAVIGLLAHTVFLGGVFAATAAGADAGTVALICAIQPMLVTVAGRLGWGDRIRPRQVVGLLLGLVAVGFTVGVGGDGGPVVLLAVGSLLGLSTAALLERRWRPRTDVITSLACQSTVAAIAFTAFALATDRLWVPVSPDLIGALAWLILLSGLGGYASFILCLRRLGATSTSLLLYLTPPVTTLWAWLMFAQTPAVGQWAALGLGAVAVLLAWPPRTRGAPEATAEPAGGRLPP